jgi:hypothetical protein
MKRIYLYPGYGEGGRHYLETAGTMNDLVESGITLAENMQLGFYDIDGSDKRDVDNLLFEGTVHYDAALKKWYALIDWKSFRHESDGEGSQTGQ